MHNQPIEEFPTFNQNLLYENKSLPMEELGLPLMNIDDMQPRNLELHQTIQPNPMDLLEKQNEAEQLIEQHQQMMNLGEQQIQVKCQSVNDKLFFFFLNNIINVYYILFYLDTIIF